MADIKQIVNTSFERYAGNVILNRAICDARDILKPSARMLMYCQLNVTKNIPSKPFIKSARVVGDALGHYYEHGDSSCYSTYMRMAKPFAMRYPLEDCQGNSGTLNATNDEASMRYTELRLSELGYRLFNDIDKETITSWSTNFDNTETYPKVACSKGFYNIVNGSIGLGIAISSSIPQFNLRETNEALIKLLWDKDIPFEQIICYPDFATGATILNAEEIKQSLEKGSGAAIKMRAVANYNAEKRTITFTELPYGVYTETISGQLQALCESNPEIGIESVNDASHKVADYEIRLKKGANPEKILKILYKETSLQSYFPVNMMVLDKGRYPCVMGWRELLQAHLDHEVEVYTRGFKFDLKKCKDRIHIIDGLMAAYNMIDEVVATIKSSSSSAAASQALQSLLSIDETQAKAILDLKLARLSKLDIAKLMDEKKDLEKEVARIEAILNDETLLKREIERGLREVAEKFGDARRTKIMNVEGENDDIVEVRQLQVSLTNHYNLFAAETSSLYSQKRGSTGTKLKLDKDEYIVNSITINTDERLLAFSVQGNAYSVNATDLAPNQKTSIYSLISIKDDNEDICTIAGMGSSAVENAHMVFITHNGFIKKTEMSEYASIRKTGTKAIKLDAGDYIVSVFKSLNEPIGLATHQGNILIIDPTDIAPIGRVSRGICAIKLSDGDYVCAAHIIPSNTKSLVSVSTRGLIKQTSMDDFAVANRATKGVRLCKLGDDDSLADFCTITDGAQVLVAASNSCIKLDLEAIPTSGRATMGVKALNLNSDSFVVGVVEI